MKYTTRAFKILIADVIEKFEKEYPDPDLQQRASFYKANLFQYIAMTKTSVLLRTYIEKEIKEMPYFFSKIGYLVQDLSNLLKHNSIKDCMETDDHEKCELETTQQNAIQTSALSGTWAVEKQLKKEEAKNKRYGEVIEQLTREKEDVRNQLQEEIAKGQAYQAKIQALLTKITELTQNSDLPVDTQALIEELKNFNKTLLEENQQLFAEKNAIFAKYQEIAALNRKLKARCDELERNYKNLNDQFVQQAQLFNTKLLENQKETGQLKQQFEKLTKQLADKQRPQLFSRFPRYGHFKRLKTAEITRQKGKNAPIVQKKSALRENIQAILPEKLNL